MSSPPISPPDWIDRSEAAAIRGGAATPANSWDAWSDSLQTVLEQPPAALPGRMILGGLLFCCAFGTWAWFGQVQEVSHAAGQLMPQGRVYKVQPVVQGEVTRILVEAGDRVEKGQLIAEVDSRLAEAEVQRLEQSLATYRLQLLQTEGLRDRTVLESQTRRAIAIAQINAQAAALSEAQAGAAMQRSMLNQIQTDQTAYAARLDRIKPLLAEGAIAQEQVFEVEQGLRDRDRAQIQNQGELDRATAEANRVRAQLEQQQAEAQQSELEAQQRLQQLELEATALKAKLDETENLLTAARTQLQQTFLYAPVNGTISALYIDNVGEVTQPGETIAEIAPADAPLILSAALPNREAGFVRSGMNVQAKFDAFPYQEYGIVTGKVISVSPDAVIDEKLGAVYRVEISIDRNSITSKAQPIQFKAGQTASAEIVVRQYRIMDVLLKPFQKLRQDNLKL